jgi:hypothetical protein
MCAELMQNAGSMVFRGKRIEKIMTKNFNTDSFFISLLSDKCPKCLADINVLHIWLNNIVLEEGEEGDKWDIEVLQIESVNDLSLKAINQHHPHWHKSKHGYYSNHCGNCGIRIKNTYDVLEKYFFRKLRITLILISVPFSAKADFSIGLNIESDHNGYFLS